MSEFLKELKLSEEATKIYFECLGKSALTRDELHSLAPNLSPENFSTVIEELIKTNLFIQILPQKPEILMHYLAVAPLTPILNYYSNIDAKLGFLENAVRDIVVKSINQIYQKDDGDKSLHDKFHELRKYFDEDSMIQKKDVDEIVENMEKVKAIKELLIIFREKAKSSIKVKVLEFLGNLTKLKNVIEERVILLDLKKKEDLVLNVIESIFKENLQQIIQDLTVTLGKTFEEELTLIENQTDNVIDTMLQLRSDFKMVFLNMLNQFEISLNKIQEEVGIKDEQNIVQITSDGINKLIKESIYGPSGINKPIEDIMQNFLKKSLSPDKIKIDNFWLIRSKLKISEEIANIIENSKEEIIIIIPKIEKYLKIEQFQNLLPAIKIKIASSDPHTNSLVKKFKEKSNLEFRTLKNENIVALKGDNTHILISLEKSESQEPLDDTVGFGSIYKPLINFLTPIIETTWAAALPDFAVSTQPKPAMIEKPIIPADQPAPAISEPIIQEPLRPVEIPPMKLSEEVSKESQEIQETPPLQETSVNIPLKSDFIQESQPQSSYVSRAYPKAGDRVGMQINNAFNAILQKLDVINGVELSKELQNIADLILENIGFSVTLHNIKNSISEFKKKKSLTENDKYQIFESIESWKEKLF